VVTATVFRIIQMTSRPIGAVAFVQTDIHHPTDSALLWDAVRVITRLVKRLGKMIPRAVSTFHNCSRAAKRRHQQIQRMTSAQC
jgi:hypothetical protein